MGWRAPLSLRESLPDGFLTDEHVDGITVECVWCGDMSRYTKVVTAERIEADAIEHRATCRRSRGR